MTFDLDRILKINLHKYLTYIRVSAFINNVACLSINEYILIVKKANASRIEDFILYTERIFFNLL